MKRLLLIAFVFIGYFTNAQDTEPIVTDRPSQSAAVSVVPKGNFLVELGFIQEKATSDITNTTFSNVHLRYGIAEGIEIRLTQNYLGLNNSLTDFSTTGLSPLTIGTKIHLRDEQGAIPQMSIIGQLTLKNGDRAFEPSRATPEVRLNFANTLSDQFSLGYNVAMSFVENDPTLYYSVILGYVFEERFTVFAEPYSAVANNTLYQFDTGLVYLCTNNIQFDITAGWGLSENAPDRFVGFGVAVGF